MTKIVTLEVDVKLSKRMDDETVTEAVDHMIEVGGVEMLNDALGVHHPVVIDPKTAIDCVSMRVSDSSVVDSVGSSEKEYDATEHEATKD